MFLAHLVLGLVIILPVVIYGIVHIRNAHDRPNRRAVKVGYALFTTALVLLASGVVLTRGLPVVEIRDPQLREVAYWLHVATPLIAAWLFVLHRLAGKRIQWRVGMAVAGVGGAFAVVMLVLQMSAISGEGVPEVLRALRSEIDENRLRHRKAQDAAEQEEAEPWRP